MQNGQEPDYGDVCRRIRAAMGNADIVETKQARQPAPVATIGTITGPVYMLGTVTPDTLDHLLASRARARSDGDK